MTIDHDFITEATRATPTVAVTGMTLLGAPLSDWVFILTIIYTLAQLIFLLHDKWYKPRKARKDNHGRDK